MIFGPILPAKQHSTQIKRIHNYYMTIWVMSLDYTELTKETTSLVVGDWLTQTVNPFSNFKQKRIKLHYFPNLHECWGWFHHIPPKPSYLNIFKPRDPGNENSSYVSYDVSFEGHQLGWRNPAHEWQKSFFSPRTPWFFTVIRYDTHIIKRILSLKLVVWRSQNPTHLNPSRRVQGLLHSTRQWQVKKSSRLPIVDE